MKPALRWICWLTVTTLPVGDALFAQQAGESPYQGSAACLVCHDAKLQLFPHNNMTETAASAAKIRKNPACESCHGPGTEHVNADDADKPAKIYGPKNIKEIEKFEEQCLGCHKDSPEKVGEFPFSAHKSHDITCSNCHQVHVPGTFKPSQPEICFTCHRDVRAQFNKIYVHPSVARDPNGPYEDGKLYWCQACHNPHERSLRSELKKERCLECHQDKGGGGTFEHAGNNEDGCLTCHDPHGAGRRFLLKAEVRMVCLDCHSDKYRKHHEASGKTCLACHANAFHGDGLAPRSVK
ncbi:MAG: cytochrome c3 family protein [Pseudomonadota bacterium]